MFLRTHGRQKLPPQAVTVMPFGPVGQIQVKTARAFGPLPNGKQPNAGPETVIAGIAAEGINAHHHARHFLRAGAA
jgi:hypothetical protein